jgi:transposase
MSTTYAGVDWASEKHDVLIADETGEEVLAATFAHDEAGVRGLCRALVRHGVTLVAIERPDGLLVERLLDAGLRILPLHPNQVAAARDRFRASGGKSDRFDAFVLCELARTDHHRFRVLEPDSDQTKALRALTRFQPQCVSCADPCLLRSWSLRRRIRSRGERLSWRGIGRSAGSSAC